MKCIHCGKQWGANAIPIVCVRCVEKMRQLDEEDHVVIPEEDVEVARRKARLESTTADNIHL